MWTTASPITKPTAVGSYAMDSQGYPTDPKHPSNRPRLNLKFGTQRNTGRESKKI